MKSTTLGSSQNLNQKLDRHFLSCSAFVGAAVAMAGTQAADAAIQYSGPQSISVPTFAVNGFGGVYIDFDGMQSAQPPSGGGAGRALLPGWDINPYSSSGGTFRFYTDIGLNGSEAVVSTVGGNHVDLLTGGMEIGPSSSFGNFAAMVTSGGTWAGNVGYAGVRFTNNPTATPLYAWVQMDVSAGNGFPATVLGWAYEDSGAPILAGAVPEPGTIALGCLAAGAAGLGVWRKRRKA